MKFKNYLNELASDYGRGITFIDIDETIFKTFAKIYILNKETGEIKRKLTNQEYNTYELQPNEKLDFREFRNAETFAKTSVPIEKTIKRIKRMFQNINKRGSKIVLLTARGNFDDKKTFLQAFRDVGIPIDKIYVERVGNFLEHPEIYKNIIKNKGMPKSIDKMKEAVIMTYLETGLYRRVRLIDDDKKNVKTFIKIKDRMPKSIIQKIKKIHNIPEDEDFPVIEFYGLLVKDDGSLKRIN